MDITCTLMAHGFVYLVAVLDWASRRVLSWRVSITLGSAFCMAAVEEALARHGRPAIFNTEQEAQFTSAAFTGLLQYHGIQISMDGKGGWRDNIVIECLWRSLEYEEVYLHACDSESDATAGIGRYFTLYNSRRPPSGRTDRTPDDAYFFPRPLHAAAWPDPSPAFQLASPVRPYREAESVQPARCTGLRTYHNGPSTTSAPGSGARCRSPRARLMVLRRCRAMPAIRRLPPSQTTTSVRSDRMPASRGFLMNARPTVSPNQMTERSAALIQNDGTNPVAPFASAYRMLLL